MAQVKIAGDAIVVTSALKLEDIKKLEKYRKGALTLMGGKDNKEPIFAIGSTSGAGSINANGASFGRATRDDDKYATITMVIPESAAGGDIKAYVADLLGEALTNLDALEKTLPDVLADVDAKRAEIMDHITVA